MSDIAEAPAPLPDGRIQTQNGRGFTTSSPDPLSWRFIHLAASCGVEVLDFGCAYGVSTIPALKAGARVCACDMDPRHLSILANQVDRERSANLTVVCGKAPEVDFAEQRFGAILSSRVLHFLDGVAVDVTLTKMFRWLRPGGKLFVISDTPYAGALRRTVPQYLARKERGERWPGLVANYASFLPPDFKNVDPPFIHLLDPDILSGACRRAGFEIEHCGFMPRIAKLDDADPQGRDHVGLIGVRP